MPEADSLFGPDSSEAKGEVGDHGSDEAGPVETELTSRCQRHTSLPEQQQHCQACMPCMSILCQSRGDVCQVGA